MGFIIYFNNLSERFFHATTIGKFNMGCATNST